MPRFVPEGYLTPSDALQRLIRVRFREEAEQNDALWESRDQTKLFHPHITERDRALVAKAEQALRSLLFKDQSKAIVFGHEGEIAIPAAFWACSEADGVLLSHERLLIREDSLRSALRPAIVDDGSGPTRTQGRPAQRLPEVKAAMIAHGDMDDLASMTQEVMKATFGASRDTCRRAREQVLSELRTNNPDN